MFNRHASLRSLIPVALLLASNVSHAQNSTPPVQTLTGPGHEVQWIGGVDGRFTRLAGEDVVLTGGRVGMLINRSTIVAFSARANLNQNIRTSYLLPDGRTAGLSFGYGGIEIGRVLAPRRAVHVTTSLLLGGGATSHHDRGWREGDPNTLPVDGFWLAEPEVQVETNVTRMLRVAIGGSYRFVHGARLQGLGDRDVRGASGSLTFTFGRF